MAKNFLKKSLLIPAIGLLMPVLAFAQGTTGTGSGDGISTPPPNVNLKQVIENIRNYFLGMVIIVCVFMILWAAFQFVTAGGDEKKVESARKTLSYAVVGLIVALLAVAIVAAVQGLVGGTAPAV